MKHETAFIIAFWVCFAAAVCSWGGAIAFDAKDPPPCSKIAEKSENRGTCVTRMKRFVSDDGAGASVVSVVGCALFQTRPECDTFIAGAGPDVTCGVIVRNGACDDSFEYTDVAFEQDFPRSQDAASFISTYNGTAPCFRDCHVKEGQVCFEKTEVGRSVGWVLCIVSGCVFTLASFCMFMAISESETGKSRSTRSNGLRRTSVITHTTHTARRNVDYDADNCNSNNGGGWSGGYGGGSGGAGDCDM